MPLEPARALRSGVVQGAEQGAPGLLTATVASPVVEPVLSAPAQDLSEVPG